MVCYRICVSIPSLTCGSYLFVSLSTHRYSHDASLCIVDEKTGQILFAQAKERISGLKHDGGATGELLRYGLRSIDASVHDVGLVVSNNHHHRVLPFERRLPFASAMHYVPRDYDDLMNLVPNAQHMELSHHLAHAWSVIGTVPLRDGALVVVMDGMGEQYKAMVEHMGGLDRSSNGHNDDYMHDLKLLRETKPHNFVGVPTTLQPGSSYREAESAYLFDGRGLIPVFKRWSRERSPPELYNHGFENMESLGAVYSRISSQVLGDWNACGKIMGLASWSGRHRSEAKDWIYGLENIDDVGLGDKFFHGHTLMSGNPYEDGSFSIDWDLLDSLPQPNQFCMSRFGESAILANSVQKNLESSAMQLVTSLKKNTGASHLALAGGVALNSVLNGRLLREGGFDSVYVPPAPGDEGVAVGCALYGFHRLRCAREDERVQTGAVGGNTAAEESGEAAAAPSVVQVAFSAYQGRAFADDIIDDAVFEHIPWIVANQYDSIEDCVDAAVEMIAGGQVVAWYQGRSEFGQRALGHRSFLADPRDPEMRRLLNSRVKGREWWRPLAPSVLAEEAGQWFEGLADGGNESPFMSITAFVKEVVRSQVPSICHIDGSARLQTVTMEDAPLYHSLIAKFKAKTGVPMVLNTSFNKKGQPIVENPEQAISTFLECSEAVEALYMGRWKVQARPFPFTMDKAGGATQMEPSAEESALSANAVRFYMSEVTCSHSLDAEPLRVRIQDGRQPSGADPWRKLPSNLHLELLQLLQPQEENNYGYSGYQAAEEDLPDVTVQELWEAMREVRGADCSWAAIRSALKWLYEARLLYFNGPSIGIDADPKQLFRDVDVLDLRTD